MARLKNRGDNEESETLVLHARCSARHAAWSQASSDQGLERAPRASHLGEKVKSSTAIGLPSGSSG